MQEEFKIKEALGERILQLCYRKSLTQAKLAEQVGVETTTLGRWIRGTTAPKLPNLWKLGKALGVSIDELISDTEISRIQPISVDYQGKSLVSLMCPPRNGEERRGLEIAKSLFRGSAPNEIMDRLNIFPNAYIQSIRRITNSMLFVETKHIPINRELSETLREKYRLKYSWVADLGSISHLLKTVVLGALGAKVITDVYRLNEVRLNVGFAGGSSCGRVITALIQAEQQPRLQLDVMPIAVRSIASVVEANANVLVGILGFFTRHTGIRVYGLPYVSNACLDREAPSKYTATRAMLERAKNVNIAFLGLGADLNYFLDEEAKRSGHGLFGGATTAFDLKQQGCIGDVLYTLVTDDGPMHAFRAACDQIVCSIGLEELQHMAAGHSIVVAVAAGEHKKDVTRLALEKRYINSLIVDSELAEAALRSK